jgi:hypothetical protein
MSFVYHVFGVLFLMDQQTIQRHLEAVNRFMAFTYSDGVIWPDAINNSVFNYQATLSRLRVKRLESRRTDAVNALTVYINARSNPIGNPSTEELGSSLDCVVWTLLLEIRQEQ